MNDDAARRRKLLLIVLGGFAALILLLAIIVLVIFSGSDEEQQDTSEYHDPGSGQTVSDPEWKAPENVNADPENPILLGFGELLKRGLTQFQFDALRLSLNEFYKEEVQGEEKEISLTVDSVERIIPQPERSTVWFDITVDRTTPYRVKLEHFDITKIQLYIYDTDDNKVYDSGVVDAAPSGGDVPHNHD